MIPTNLPSLCDENQNHKTRNGPIKKANIYQDQP